VKNDGDNQKKFIPQLAINNEYFQHTFANPCDVKPKAQLEWCAPYCTIGI
jgi:hypothetical protein